MTTQSPAAKLADELHALLVQHDQHDMTLCVAGIDDEEATDRLFADMLPKVHDELRRLDALVTQNAKDAARYRRIRNPPKDSHGKLKPPYAIGSGRFGLAPMQGSELDAFADAALTHNAGDA